MMEAARTSETSVDNHFTRQYNPEDSSEHNMIVCFKQCLLPVSCGRTAALSMDVHGNSQLFTVRTIQYP
jgi:hypothetical protein